MSIYDDSDNILKSVENYSEMESKLKAIISKCDKNALKDQSNGQSFLDVKNANKIEHYIIEGGLHVYKFLNGNKPIDYFISSSPIVEQYEYTNNNKKFVNKKYTEVPFFEYSCGGPRNSLPINVDKYHMSQFIGVSVPSRNGAYPISDITAVSGDGLRADLFSKLGNDIYSLYNRNKETRDYFKTGDLFNYINSLNPDERDKNIVEQLKNTLSKINQVTLKVDQSKDKKSEFKGLFSRFKKDSNELEPFSERRR